MTIQSTRFNVPWQTLLATVLGTAYLSFLISLNWRGGWVGYAAGVGDHTVLMPQGVAWAVPGAFENDWFMQAAPQPHWFFDIIVAAGMKSGTLDLLLLGYWLAGLVAYSLATVLLARMLVPARPLIATTLVLTLTGLTPWMLFGTGTPNIGMALPAVLTSSLIYLAIVLLLRGNTKSAAVLAVASAALHVQQGAIIAVVFGAVCAVQWISRRRIPPLPLILGFVGSTAFVIFGLRLRPVAANLSDFVEVCNTVIPYHCAAGHWPLSVKLGTLGGLALAAVTLVAFKSVQRTMWLSSVGLVVLGLGLGFLADERGVPVLGELAQAVNVYRLGAVTVPFMLWGMMLPVLPLKLFPRLFERKWAVCTLWALWALAVLAVFLDPSWGVMNIVVNQQAVALVMLLIAGIVLGYLAVQQRAVLPWAAVTTVVSLLLVSAAVTGTLVSRPGFQSYSSGGTPTSLEWYESVKNIVPQGEVITAPGDTSTLRLYSQRAFIADCKNVPYGGEAWREWQQRISDIGSCFGDKSYSEKFMLDDYERVAKKYNSHYVILGPEAIERNLKAIQEAEWEPLLTPNESVGWTLYKIPSLA